MSTNTINAGGVNGTNSGVVNVNSDDYKELLIAINEYTSKIDIKTKIKYKLFSIKLQMESYIADPIPDKILNSGFFLKEILIVLEIKNKTFASYIDIEESNLSAILSGKRNITIELAYKLGQLLDIDPIAWLQIQNKNELVVLTQNKKIGSKTYLLDDLMVSLN